MPKLLFVTDSYGNKASANGICVSEVAEFCRDKEHEVHILCLRKRNEANDEIVNGIHIHRIEANPINYFRGIAESGNTSKIGIKIAKILFLGICRSQSMFFLYRYPLRTPIYSRRYAAKIGELHDQYLFDGVIASYAPSEAIEGTYIFKEKNPEVFTCMYLLDSISNLTPRWFLSKEWLDHKGWKTEQKMYRSYDLILNLKCHDRHYSQKRYDIYRKKMASVDVPHMSETVMSESSPCKEAGERISFLYAGLYRKNTGNYVMCLLSEFAVENNIVIDLYSRSDRSLFEKNSSKELMSRTNWHGFVSREEVLKEELRADILICLGNTDSDFIPSKIFELILSGNKVLHFYDSDNDTVIPYLKKYRNACLIDVRKSVADNMVLLKQFCKGAKSKISRSELFDIYKENTPEFTYRTIEKYRNLKN